MAGEPTEEEIEKRALQLQARGPDEYPFGYYRWLAEQQLKEEPCRS